MKIIELFFLNFRHVIISANSLTASFLSENNIFISSMIVFASKIASISKIVSIINIAIFSAIEIKRSFKYIVSMSFSEINEISYFQNQNVSNFLNRFDFMCENYEFFEIDRIKRLSWYCEKIIDEYLRMFTEFNDEFWQKIKKVLRKKYEKQNVNQQMNTKEFFETLIRKFRTERNLKIYCRQFYAIFTKLYKRKRLNEHIRMRWFFQRLSKETIIKIMKKHNYDDIDDEMLNFEIMHKTTIKMNDVAKILKKLTVITNSENKFKHLIENSQSFVFSFISKIDIFTSTMIKSIIETENVNQLIQMLFDFAFAFRAQVDQFFIFAISINYFQNAFNTTITYFNSISFE